MTTPVPDLDLRRLGQPGLSTDGSSALALAAWHSHGHHTTAVTDTPARLVLVPLPGEHTHCAEPQQPSLEAVRAQACGLAQALVEIVAGDRSLTQLVRWTTAEVYEQLHHRVLALHGCQPAAEPGGAAAAPARRRRAKVATVHLSQPADGVVEVAARVSHGPRSTALALRLERRVGARRVHTGGVLQRVPDERWVAAAVTWS